MLDREIAGITCRAVLAGLEAYLAGDLDAGMVGRVEAHLGECDRCARFGGAYAAICQELNALLGRPEPLGRPTRDRLKRRLDEALGSSPAPSSQSDRDAPD